jgi:hypothetical protein
MPTERHCPVLSSVSWLAFLLPVQGAAEWSDSFLQIIEPHLQALDAASEFYDLLGRIPRQGGDC